MPGLSSGRTRSSLQARVAAGEGDELVAGTGRAGQPDRVGEQPRAGAWRHEQRGDRQQDGRQARRDRPGRAARGRDVPAVDGDLDGPGHRDHARGQLTVPNGHPAPARPGRSAGAQQSGGLAAQPRNRVPPGPVVTPLWRSADACGGDRLVQHPDRVGEVVQQRFEVPSGARSGPRQELWSDQGGTGQRVADRRFEQLQSPVQRSHGVTARSYAEAGPAAVPPYSCGRPNEANRPGSTKATIRAIPRVVTVSTCNACAWYIPPGSRSYTANAGCPFATTGTSRSRP